MSDYYQALGVSRDASPDEIKRAYRRLAREHHPDANPGNPESEAQFKEIALAYETLSDSERRSHYDRFGTAEPGGSPFAGAGGFGDLFDAFFGGNPFGGGGGGQAGPPRGSDLEVTLDLGFEDAVFGTEAPVSVRTALACEECEATGAAPGSGATTCPDCGGAGQVRRVRQSILGQMVTASPCPRCNALGTVIEQPCPACRGDGRVIAEKTYTVDVPAGVDTGSTLRLTGRGAAGPRGGGVGDLYVHLRVRDHDRFQRHGYDLVCELPVSFAQAALGVELAFETLDGVEDLVVSPGTQSGKVMRLRGRGVPHVEGRGRGDLLIPLVVETPTRLGDEEEALLRQLAELRSEDVAPPEAGLLAKIRSAFK